MSDYSQAEGARLNTVLGKRIFRAGTVTTEEVQQATGLTIRELILCWLFDSRNDFQKALEEWRETSNPMQFDEIRR